jgi:predicted RNA-binding protein (virulence factor B family)
MTLANRSSADLGDDFTPGLRGVSLCCGVMAIIGKRNTLSVVREAPPGLYLDGGEQGEILLPGRYIPRGIIPGDKLDVFIYLDSEDRLVATTETPYATVGEFAYLEVVGVNRQIGAFLNWGLAKDLLLPFREQETPVHPGQRVIAYVYLDQKTNRIAATTRLYRHLNRQPLTCREGQPVKLLISGRTPLGYNAIVENTHLGLLYHDNVATPLAIGQRVDGFVRGIRSGGKIDLSLEASGYKRVASLTEQIVQALERQGGRLEFDDESSPETIREVFGTSKKAFKQALGSLYKARRIRFQSPGIELLDNTSSSPASGAIQPPPSRK